MTKPSRYDPGLTLFQQRQDKEPDQPGARWAVWKWFIIRYADGVAYLRRLRIIQTPWFGVYLHWIEGPDPDRWLHDHPWSFLTFILRGGYTEIFKGAGWAPFQGKARLWSRFTLHRMQGDDAHKITKLKFNTLTLVLVGQRRRQWGFHTDKGWMPWHEYLESIDGTKAKSQEKT